MTATPDLPTPVSVPMSTFASSPSSPPPPSGTTAPATGPIRATPLSSAPLATAHHTATLASSSSSSFAAMGKAVGAEFEAVSEHSVSPISADVQQVNTLAETHLQRLEEAKQNPAHLKQIEENLKTIATKKESTAKRNFFLSLIVIAAVVAAIALAVIFTGGAAGILGLAFSSMTGFGYISSAVSLAALSIVHTAVRGYIWASASDRAREDRFEPLRNFITDPNTRPEDKRAYAEFVAKLYENSKPDPKASEKSLMQKVLRQNTWEEERKAGKIPEIRTLARAHQRSVGLLFDPKVFQLYQELNKSVPFQPIGYSPEHYVERLDDLLYWHGLQVLSPSAWDKQINEYRDYGVRASSSTRESESKGKVSADVVSASEGAISAELEPLTKALDDPSLLAEFEAVDDESEKA